MDRVRMEEDGRGRPEAGLERNERKTGQGNYSILKEYVVIRLLLVYRCVMA